MVTVVRPAPHDLVWIADPRLLQGEAELAEWVSSLWSPRLPLVVRRARATQPGLLPVGVRGEQRSQRAAAWIPLSAVHCTLTPEQVLRDFAQQKQREENCAPLQALQQLLQVDWPWRWGVTGGCGYQLATGSEVLHATSDLDVLIYAPAPCLPALFTPLLALLPQLPCRVDIQLETALGACSLREWVSCVGTPRQKILLKRDDGPWLVRDPWQLEGAAECR